MNHEITPQPAKLLRRYADFLPTFPESQDTSPSKQTRRQIQNS
jgi:hypothetical protein